MAAVPETKNHRDVYGSLTIEVQRTDAVCQLRAAGELDMGTAPALQKELQRALASDVGVVTLDVEGLEFIDAVGVRCLVQAATLSRSDGDRLRIRAGHDPVARILSLTRTDQLLPLVR